MCSGLCPRLLFGGHKVSSSSCVFNINATFCLTFQISLLSLKLQNVSEVVKLQLWPAQAGQSVILVVVVVVSSSNAVVGRVVITWLPGYLVTWLPGQMFLLSFYKSSSKYTSGKRPCT